MPTGIGIIDTMMGTRAGSAAALETYAFLQAQLKDDASRQLEMPAGYLFKDVPHQGEEPPQGADLLLPSMDRHGVEKALISVSNQAAEDALTRHPDRFLASAELDPNRGMEGVREVVRKHEQWGLKALTVFPAGLLPQVPIDDDADVPDLRQGRRARPARLLLRRHARAAAPVRRRSRSSSSTR